MREKESKAMKYCFGVDIGGTTVKMGLFEESGTILDKWEITTDTSEEGKAILPNIAAWIEENRDHVCHWVLVDDLKHLHRGGRLPAVAAVAGIALGIKPLIRVTEEGKLEPIGKVRGRKKGIEYLLKKTEETCVDPQKSIMWVVHTACEEEAKDFCRTLKSQFHPKELYLSEIGPIIGAHTGPNVLAVVFLGTHK